MILSIRAQKSKMKRLKHCNDDEYGIFHEMPLFAITAAMFVNIVSIISVFIASIILTTISTASGIFDVIA